MAWSSESRVSQTPTVPLASMAGWSSVGRVVADGDRVLPRRPPAEGLEDVDHGLDARQRQAGRSRSFEVEVNFQARRGLPRLIELLEVAAAVEVEVELLGSERLAGGREQRVDQLLGRHPPPRRGREDAGRARSGRVGRPLVGVRVEDQPGEVLQVVVVRDQLAGQPARAARGASACPSPSRRPARPGPRPMYRFQTRLTITWANRSFAGAVISAASRSRGSSASSAERPARAARARRTRRTARPAATVVPGFERDRDQRLAAAAVQLVERDAAGRRARSAASRRACAASCEEVLLRRLVWNGASWQRAHFISTPRNAVATIVRLGRHRGVVLRRDRRTRPGRRSAGCRPSGSARSRTGRAACCRRSDSWRHQRNGPVLFRVGLRMFGFSASTSCQ